MKRYHYILISIFLLAALLRFYRLDSVPAGFYRDEAFLGYNAYSILKTAHDMSGHFLPLHLESFLFSPAGYSYFSLPFLFLFGVSAFSVRFAGAFMGSLTVFAVYLFTKELFFKRKDAAAIALLASFLLASTPWHINLSRVSTENVLVVFFITVGMWLYLLWMRKNNMRFFLFSFLSFGLTLFIYQAPRAFLPLLLPCLFLFALPKIKSSKAILSVVAFSMVIILPVLLILTSPKLSTRIHMLSIFQDPQTQLVINERTREDGMMHMPRLETRIFDNKIIGYGEFFLQNYFKHFSYEFLFTDAGLPDRYRVAGMGLLYLFDIPLLLIGIWLLLKEEKKIGLFLLIWVLLAPVGSALTYDDIPNLQRTLLIFPSLSIISAYGFVRIWQIKIPRVEVLVKTIGVLIVLYSVFYYLQAYYVHQPVHRPWYREEGFKQLVDDINKELPNYKILITSSQSDPAIFFLFYNKYDPLKTQQLLQKSPTSRYGSMPFEKYTFAQQDCPLQSSQELNRNTGVAENIVHADPFVLYVNSGECKIPQSNVEVLDEIKRGDGTVVFRILRYIP